MPVNEPTGERNLDGYGAPPIAWASVRQCLEQGLSQRPGSGGPGRHTHWLATVRPNGRPHVMPLGAFWSDGAFYFNAGPNTRKAKNLAYNPSCVLTVAAQAYDLVVQGEAVQVAGEPKVKIIGEVYESRGWRVSVTDGALQVHGDFSAPSAGPPPWNVYEMTPKTIFAVGMVQPYGATRWHF